jgi:hypothetical protein
MENLSEIQSSEGTGEDLEVEANTSSVPHSGPFRKQCFTESGMYCMISILWNGICTEYRIPDENTGKKNIF